MANGGGKELMNDARPSPTACTSSVPHAGLEASFEGAASNGVAGSQGPQTARSEGPRQQVFAAAGAAGSSARLGSPFHSLDKGVIDAPTTPVLLSNNRRVHDVAMRPGLSRLPLHAARRDSG